jgi:hypothetical protein
MATLTTLIFSIKIYLTSPASMQPNPGNYITHLRNEKVLKCSPTNISCVTPLMSITKFLVNGSMKDSFLLAKDLDMSKSFIIELLMKLTGLPVKD